MKPKNKHPLLVPFQSQNQPSYQVAFEDYEDAKGKAIAFRQTARVGLLGGLGLIGGGIIFTAKPASQALHKYNRAQAKLARFQRRTIDLNILIDEYQSDQLEEPNRKDGVNVNFYEPTNCFSFLKS